jgi:hypothetical protein
MRMRSGQSARRVRTQRAAWAFAFGPGRVCGVPRCFGPDNLAEGVAELRVAVADETVVVATLDSEVERLPADRGSVRV